MHISFNLFARRVGQSTTARACDGAGVYGILVPIQNQQMSSTPRIGTTVMVPAFLLAEFDTFANDRGTDRSEEVRAAYRTHMDDPPDVEDVEALCEHMDEETEIPRPSAKVMLDADLLREDAAFRDSDEGRDTDRSAEICAAMYRHLEDPPAVTEVTDALHARVRAQSTDELAAEH